MHISLLADQGIARDCSTKRFVNNSFVSQFSERSFSSYSRHAQTVGDVFSSHKINYAIVITIATLQCIGSKVKVVLLRVCILPIG